VLRHHFAWKRLSIAAALVYEPDGSDAHLIFQLRPDANNGESLIAFLSELHQHEQQRVVLLIWGGLRTSQSVRNGLDCQPALVALGRATAWLCAGAQSDGARVGQT
jgi:hypothetical protein